MIFGENAFFTISETKLGKIFKNIAQKIVMYVRKQHPKFQNNISTHFIV